MSQSFDATLTLELRRSPWLAAALLVVHAGALLIAAVVPVAPLVRAGLVAAVAVSAGYAAIRHTALADRMPFAKRFPSIVAVEWDAAGDWAIRYARGTVAHACVLRDRWLHTHLVILRLRRVDDGKTVNVLIPADATAAEAFRRLRARLRLQTAAAPR